MFTPSKVSFLLSALLAGAAFTHNASAMTAMQSPMTRSVIDNPLVNMADQLARRGRGADDKGADDRGGRGRRGTEGADHPAIEVSDQLARRGRGADDKGADDRGGHGRRG